jgi:hypothetical protein
MYTALELGLELSDLLWDDSIINEQQDEEHDFINDDKYELPF